MAISSKRRRKRPDKRGRGEGQYMTLPYVMAHSAAFRGLSGPAVKVWIELRTRYNGGNNGQLHLSMGEAARLLRLSKSTVQRAFKELEEAGFIVLMKQGQWYGRMAHEWRSTDIQHNGFPASRDYERAGLQKTERGTDTGHMDTTTVPSR